MLHLVRDRRTLTPPYSTTPPPHHPSTPPQGLFCDVASELYNGLMVPGLTTSKRTMYVGHQPTATDTNRHQLTSPPTTTHHDPRHCTGAAINLILMGLATTYWIHQRVLHARTKESRDRGEPMQGGWMRLHLYQC